MNSLYVVRLTIYHYDIVIVLIYDKTNYICIYLKVKYIQVSILNEI